MADEELSGGHSPSPKLRQRLMDKVNEAKSQVLEMMDDTSVDDAINIDTKLDEVVASIERCRVHGYVGIRTPRGTKMNDPAEITRVSGGKDATPNDILMLCTGMLIQVEEEIRRVSENIGDKIRKNHTDQIPDGMMDLERAITACCLNVILDKLATYAENKQMNMTILDMLTRGDRAFNTQEKMFVYGDSKWAILENPNMLKQRNLEVLR